MADPVLIFGASGGIGGAVARLLASDGRSLYLTGRDDERLAAIAAELGAGARSADVRDEAALADIVEAAMVDGRLAGLVFAVGSIDLMPLRRAEARHFMDAYALNVVAAASAVRLAAPALRAAEGAVVLFSSVAARLGFRNHAVIGAAKAGVEGLARALAADLAPRVRVNCIAPSLTRTHLSASLIADARMADSLASQHALGRLGEPADIAHLTAFLLGPGGRFMTGQILAVDGGRGDIAG